MTSSASLYTQQNAFESGLRLDPKQVDARSPEAIKAVAQQFEALFMQQMLQNMRSANSSLVGEHMMSSSQSDFYYEWFDQKMALHSAQSQGFGLAAVIEQQLSRQNTAAQESELDMSLIKTRILAALATQPSKLESNADKSTTNVEKFAIQKPESVENAEVQEGEYSLPSISKKIRQVLDSSSKEGFVKTIYQQAQNAAKVLGQPAGLLVAQAVLETGWGKHQIRDEQGNNSHNIFAIKAGADWQGEKVSITTHEYIDGNYVKLKDEFRSYGSYEEALNDYVAFLKESGRYQQAIASDNEQDYMQGLQAAGYATDPAYAEKILSLYNADRLQSIMQSAEQGEQ